jgi:hypothetical protein
MGLLDLVNGDGFRERRDTPVGDAADDTTVAKDESADSLGDLLYFGKGARTDLLAFVSGKTALTRSGICHV